MTTLELWLIWIIAWAIMGVVSYFALRYYCNCWTTQNRNTTIVISTFFAPLAFAWIVIIHVFMLLLYFCEIMDKLDGVMRTK